MGFPTGARGATGEDSTSGVPFPAGIKPYKCLHNIQLYIYSPVKSLHWLGTSLDDLRAFPERARIEAGTDLRLVQKGVEPRDWKPMPEVGRGVREIRNRRSRRRTGI
jgi:hypothetical protein